MKNNILPFLYFYSILDLNKSIFSRWFDRVDTTPSFKKEITVFFSEFEIKSNVEFSYNVDNKIFIIHQFFKYF